MGIPTTQEIVQLLERETADELESEWLEFKSWTDPKEAMRTGIEYAVCFANADGGVVVFGVDDRAVGRQSAIHGVSGCDLDTWQREVYAAVRPNLRVELELLAVPEGTRQLLLMRVPRGENGPYGTARGVFTRRVGKSCMPLDAQAFSRARLQTGVIDWSGEPAENVAESDLDLTEVSRARRILKQLRQNSELAEAPTPDLLSALGATRNGRVTRTGLLLFGHEDVLQQVCPQHQVHYVYQVGDTRAARNDAYRFPLLKTLELIELAFSGPANPEHELEQGLLKLRVPAFPLEVVREAVLNAVTHRDYTAANEVLIRHSQQEFVVSSPGGFIAGITPRNILRQEPFHRNRLLAEAFQKLGLVERAGMGRRRIFSSLLGYGKRIPEYTADPDRVSLRIFDGTLDERMARMIATWRSNGRDVDLDTLLVLSYLREHAFLDAAAAAELLQLPSQNARSVLDRMAQPRIGILERKGRTKAATFHLNKAVAKDLLGRAGYTRLRGIDPGRFREIVREHVALHGRIDARECRELLGLGESRSARVEASNLLRSWSGPDGFLRKIGTRGRGVYYLPNHPESGH